APAGRVTRAHFDRPLIAALKRAHRELGRHGILLREATTDVSDARGLPDPYLRRIAALAFLAPDIQRSILDGRQSPGVNLKRLTQVEQPIDWAQQRARFGFGDP